MRLGTRPGTHVGLHRAPSSTRQRAPRSRRLGTRAARCLVRLCSLGRGKFGGVRGRGRITPTSYPFSGGPFSTRCSLPRGPGDVCSPVSLVGLAQPRADPRSRDGAIQHPAPSPLALPLPWPVAQSMVLVKTRKYLYKNNLKNMVCQIIKAAEHLRSFQPDWEIRCCSPKALCDAGGACGLP